jgi:hypothetical protein
MEVPARTATSMCYERCLEDADRMGAYVDPPGGEWLENALKGRRNGCGPALCGTIHLGPAIAAQQEHHGIGELVMWGRVLAFVPR